MEYEVCHIARRVYVVKWTAEKERSGAAIVAEQWSAKLDGTELHCYKCKRANDCDHVYDVQRFRKQSQVDDDQPKKG